MLSLQAAETAGSTLTPTGGAPAAEFTAGSTLTPTSGAPAAEFMPAELASCRASAAVVNTAGSTLKTGLAKAAGERRPR